jgi:hypothetical protein
MNDILKYLYYHHLEYRDRFIWDYEWKICTQKGHIFNILDFFVEHDFINKYGIRNKDG